MRRDIPLMLLAIGLCWSIGCSEKTAGPDENPLPVPGKHLWSKKYGDYHDGQASLAIAADGSGNVIVTGYFDGQIDFGGDSLTSAGGRDIFLAKLESSGAHVWSKRFGDGSDQQAQSIAVDASGNVVIAGIFRGTVDFGGGPLASAGDLDIFVAKFSPDGAYLWSARFGDGDEQRAGCVAVDASGNVIVVGGFYGTVDFGGGALASAGGDDIFIARFDSDGAHLWSKRFGDGSGQAAEAVAVDGTGNMIITGRIGGTVDFGGGALVSEGLENVFVAKFEPDGEHIWSKRFGHTNFCAAPGIAVDASGNLIVAGHFQSTIDFGAGPLVSAGAEDIFVAKFSARGTDIWSKRFGDEEYQYGQSVAVDPSGDAIVTGYFDGVVDFGGGPLAGDGTDVFIAKLGN